jgi:ABC-type Fe3+-citrate transport system substrate-binding protein
LRFIKKGIEEKDHQLAYSYAHKIKPTLDLLGLNVAYEENLLVMEWTKREGKRKEIKEVFKSIEDQVDKAVKEIHKDFNL